MLIPVDIFHAHALLESYNPKTREMFPHAIRYPSGMSQAQEEAIIKAVYGDDCDIKWDHNFIYLSDTLYLIRSEEYQNLQFKEEITCGECKAYLEIDDDDIDYADVIISNMTNGYVYHDYEDAYQLYNDAITYFVGYCDIEFKTDENGNVQLVLPDEYIKWRDGN